MNRPIHIQDLMLLGFSLKTITAAAEALRGPLPPVDDAPDTERDTPTEPAASGYVVDAPLSSAAVIVRAA